MKILKNDSLNSMLEEKGFATFPLLHAQEIAEWIAFLQTNLKELPAGLFATSHAINTETRRIFNDFLVTKLQAKVLPLLEACALTGATYMIKNNGPAGILKLHQDWTIVDETKFRSFNLWLPLVDVNEQNGTIEIIEGSHKWQKTFRGVNLPNPYENASAILKKRLQPICLKAGEALLYDHRLLHASGVNHSNTPRIVVVAGVLPNNASLNFYVRKEKKIQCYAATPEFYLYSHPSTAPSVLPLTHEFEYAFQQAMPPNLSLYDKIRMKLRF